MGETEVKTWYIAGNNLPEFRSGSIIVVERPWRISLAKWIIDQLEWLCCSHCNPLVAIPFPTWLHHTDEDGYTYPLSEWYGDLGGYLWAHVYDPAVRWFWNHAFKYEKRVEIGYDRLREAFYDNYKEYFDRVEDT